MALSSETWSSIEPRIIPVLFGGVGVYALIQAHSFPFSAGFWPQFVAAVLVGCVTLAMLGDRLPGALQRLTEEERLIGDDGPDDVADDVVDRVAEDGGTELTTPGSDLMPATTFTALALIGYVTLGYLVGLLWATPIFVAFYMRWFDRPWPLVAFVAAITFGLGYVFVDVLYLQIAEGILFDGSDLL